MKDKNVDEVSEYFDAWLERSKQVGEAAPIVREIKEYIDWSRDTLAKSPTDAVSTARVSAEAEALFHRMKASLPMPPIINGAVLKQLGSTATTSGSAVVMYVGAVAQAGTPDAIEYAKEAIAKYRKIQESHERPRQVRALVETCFPSVLARFDAARDTYARYKAGHANETAAALEIRTFLEGLKGELLDRARLQPKEKNMTLEITFDRLYSAAPNRADVKKQFDQHPSLMNDLSQIAKRRSASFQLDALWSRVLDHAYIVVGALG